MSMVEEFLESLRRNTTPSARWHKADLHHHSRASHDFRSNRLTPV